MRTARIGASEAWHCTGTTDLDVERHGLVSESGNKSVNNGRRQTNNRTDNIRGLCCSTRVGLKSLPRLTCLGPPTHPQQV